MEEKKKSDDRISIPIFAIIGVVASILLIPFSLYIFNKDENDYLKQLKEAEVKGIQSEASSQVQGAEDISEVKYFVSVEFNGVYRTISNTDFASLLTDSKLNKAKFDEYIDTKVISYFDGIYAGTTQVSNSNGEFETKVSDIIPDYSTLYEKVNELYSSGTTDIRVEVEGKDSPGTDGKYAEKYMEADNSQQKLYVWKDEKIEKVIGLSGPVAGWEVYGVFPIVDKGREPVTADGKYMPYWMAFYYSPKQSSWYGLHGLIWKYEEDGSKWYEPESNIYTRQSAGCIRMVLADAKYLYENFEKGDLLLIHE